MDALLKHSQQQGEIFEALTFFKKAMLALNKEGTPEYVRNIRKLFEKDIVEHLRSEENEIFPIVLKIGTLPEKRVIRSLQRDHINVLEKIDQFTGLIAGYGAQPDESLKAELAQLNKEIIEMMLTHSRREDAELFPLLKEIGCRIEGSKMRCE